MTAGTVTRRQEPMLVQVHRPRPESSLRRDNHYLARQKLVR
jgi:hypothetical protein